MRFGVNYTPRQGWFHSWLDMDLASVAQDFAALKRLGLDHVRVFPLWPLLQPNRTLIRRKALDDVRDVVKVAGDNGLDVVVDVLQGHMSSYDFLPSWVTSWHRRNIFTDCEVVAGECELLRALAETVSQEENALGLSLGNEIIQFAAHRHPYRHEITTIQAADWLDTLLEAARDSWPSGLHTHSYDDDLFFDTTHPFTPSLGATKGDLTTVHSWIFGRLGPMLGHDHPGLATFARYLCELASAWSKDPDRGIWLQEVGAPQTHLSEEYVATFVRDTLRHLQSCHKLWGVTWWCSHDVSRTLADFPALEYTLGLLDEEGKIKASGQALAEMIADWPDSLAEQHSTLTVSAGDVAAVREITSPEGSFFRQWMESALRGDYPKIEIVSLAQPLA